MTEQQTSNDHNAVEGWVVDIACLRKYPHDELASRAGDHTTACALMGHCVESGYGLVTADGRVHLLDHAATPHVVAALHQSTTEAGLRLAADRHDEDGEMVTSAVREIAPT